MSRRTEPPRDAGMSVLELLVGTLIGLAVIAGVPRLFDMSDTAARAHDRALRAEEQAAILIRTFGKAYAAKNRAVPILVTPAQILFNVRMLERDTIVDRPVVMRNTCKAVTLKGVDPSAVFDAPAWSACPTRPACARGTVPAITLSVPRGRGRGTRDTELPDFAAPATVTPQSIAGAYFCAARLPGADAGYDISFTVVSTGARPAKTLSIMERRSVITGALASGTRADWLWGDLP